MMELVRMGIFEIGSKQRTTGVRQDRDRPFHVRYEAVRIKM